MTRKIIAGCLAVLLLGGLAYYSSYLLSAKHARIQQEEFQKQLTKERRELLLPETSPKSLETEGGQGDETAKERAEVSADPASVQTEQEQYTYYLAEEFGYINIYLADRETIYEYTDIPIDSLPEEVQEEICMGKGLTSDQELYDFLENYSS